VTRPLALVALLLLGPLPALEGDEAATVKQVEKLGGKTSGKPVTEVDLSAAALADKDLEILSDLPGLETLYLNGARVGDRNLKHLAGVFGRH
jgi:hypothetical protein